MFSYVVCELILAFRQHLPFVVNSMITLCDGAKKCIYLAMNKMQTWIQMRKMSLVWGTATTKTSENILSTLSEIILKKKKTFQILTPSHCLPFCYHFQNLVSFCWFVLFLFFPFSTSNMKKLKLQSSILLCSFLGPYLIYWGEFF